MSGSATTAATFRAQSSAQGNRTRRACRAPAGGAVAAIERRNRLLVELLPQVRYIARRVHDRLPSHVPFEDVYHAGVIGLMDAFKKFDPRKRVLIQSYMKFRIRGAILDGLRELDWGPRELRKKAREVERAEHRLRGRLGRSPAEFEIAKEAGLSLGQFQHLLGELRGLELGSLQDIAATSADGDEQDFNARLAAPERENPFHRCVDAEKRERLGQAIAQLPEKERQVLALYYFEELTMKEIGEVLAVGESRVSQIHSMALLRLRGLLGGSLIPVPGDVRPAQREVAPPLARRNGLAAESPAAG